MKKQALREIFRDRRKLLTDSEVSANSQAIARLFFSYFQVETLRAVHCYLPIRRQKEVDTFPIIYTIQEEYLKTHVVIPRSLPETGEMEHYRWLPDMTLAMNRWGILEPNPVHSLQFTVASIDLVIVPLLAFDKQGHRVGYGKGFYDRFLARCAPKTIKVGICMFEPITQIDDVNAFDIRLDYCITPNRVWKMASNQKILS